MNRELRKTATDLISSQFRGLDCSDLPDETVVGWIEESYLGGWAKFEADNKPEVTPPPAPETPYQLLYKVRAMTGVQIRLKMFEEIDKVIVEDDHITVLVNICDTVEHRSQYTIKRTGLRAIKITRSDRGFGRITDEFEMWDEDSGQVHKRREPETPRETRLREEWESLCYRPGTARNPLDNYDSVDSDTMRKYWKQT